MSASASWAAALAGGALVVASERPRVPAEVLARRAGPVRARHPAARRLVAGTVAGLAMLSIAGVVLTAGALGLAVVVACLRARSARRDRESRAAVGMVEFARSLAAELRVGASSRAAVAAAVRAAPAPLREHLAPTFGLQGAPFETATDRAGDRVPNSVAAPLARLVACWRLGARSGAALASAVDRLADGWQDDLDLRRDLDAVLAGPRATVQLLAVLPMLGVLLGAALGARPLEFLTGTPPGRLCLAAALVLNGIGIGWARRIARRPGGRSRHPLGDVPAALDLMAACLDAGAAPDRAVRAAGAAVGGAAGELLRTTSRLLELGAPADAAWARCLEAPGWAPAARTIVRTAETGSALSAVLTRLADDRRRALRTDAAAAAATAGVRIVLPLGACFLPAFVLLGVVPVVAGFAQAVWLG